MNQAHERKCTLERIILYPVILLITMIFFITACANKPKEQTPIPPYRDGTPQTQADQGAEETPAPELVQDGYNSGMYKVGTDIPAGEYKLFSTEGHVGASYFEVAKDSSNTIESIIANDNFITFTYITVEEGHFFKFIDSLAIPSGQAARYEPVNDRYISGMYKVGADIPPGEYRVFPEEDTLLGFGYFEISESSSHRFEDILANDNFQDPRYITLQQGQYLKLSEAYINAR